MTESDSGSQPQAPIEEAEPSDALESVPLEAVAGHLATSSAAISPPEADSLEELKPKSLNDTLVEEVVIVEERIRARTEQAERLRALADRIEDGVEKDLLALKEAKEILGESSQLGLGDFDLRLGGKRLEEVAIEVLRSRDDPAAEIHYRDWFKLINDAGFRVGGQVPLNTFLAQLQRSEAVENMGRRTGLYRLKV